MSSYASLVCIGTEVTSGQIINSNAQRLAMDLEQLGIEVRKHVAVDDDSQRIFSALTFAAQDAQILVVTGGLGPTSDDITRNAIAQWSDRPLEFDPSSWKQIEDTFARMGRTPTEMQRQQAFFPKGARVLINTRGTANGFILKLQNLTLYVLPGPPRELEYLWSTFIEADIQKHWPSSHKQLVLFRCRGKGESDFALIAENVLKNSGLKIGYRLDAPFVEIKVWVDHAEKAKPFLESLTKELGSYLKETRIQNAGLIN